MSGVSTLPRRSIAIVFLSALVSLLRWLILVVIALLLAPYVLAHVEQPRGHAAAAGLSVPAIGAGAVRDGIVSRATARHVRQQLGRWQQSMQLGEEAQAAAPDVVDGYQVASWRSA